MANVTISLVWNAKTRKRDIIIDYQSDADALAIEHEQAHKKIVEQLLEDGVLASTQAGYVVLSRQKQISLNLQNTQAISNDTESNSNFS